MGLGLICPVQEVLVCRMTVNLPSPRGACLQDDSSNQPGIGWNRCNSSSLQEGLGEEQNLSAVAAVASFHEVICSGQEHTQKATQHIQDGVTNIVDKVHVLLVYWEKKYKHVWETDKDAFIR